ncbi:hypothetical protein IHE50_02310 [Candidatus Parvarchaeota archaeon]|uniref:KaiC-like domain-containing protein n=1 Tax=Candidatus Acidifodinimicrobium mancum TaxID=2898728 RepID=A0A8T3UUH2_9ARCH|nr:hypothetical protein [Candidatus Acidifodinimicrobium mancum]MBE5729518.1 hypothetical protein [Candidatus Acidifodinimicrobium mancum]
MADSEMLDDIKRLVKSTVSLLLLNEREKLNNNFNAIFNSVSSMGFTPVYVTGSVPGDAIENKLLESGVKNYKIIDTITRSLYKDIPKFSENVVVLDSPADLTRLSISLENIVNENKNLFVFIDSITSFSIYNSQNEMLRFIHYVSSLSHEKKQKTVFVVINDDGVDSTFIDKVRSFIDEEIKL